MTKHAHQMFLLFIDVMKVQLAPISFSIKVAINTTGITTSQILTSWVETAWKMDRITPIHMSLSCCLIQLWYCSYSVITLMLQDPCTCRTLQNITSSDHTCLFRPAGFGGFLSVFLYLSVPKQTSSVFFITNIIIYKLLVQFISYLTFDYFVCVL